LFAPLPEGDDQAIYTISELGKRYVADELGSHEQTEIEDRLSDD